MEVLLELRISKILPWILTLTIINVLWRVHTAHSLPSTRLSPQVNTLYVTCVSCFAFTPSTRAPRSNALYKSKRVRLCELLTPVNTVDALGGGKLYRYRAMTMPSACFTKLLVHAYSLKLLIRHCHPNKPCTNTMTYN
jgi:hypothetical protein